MWKESAAGGKKDNVKCAQKRRAKMRRYAENVRNALQKNALMV